MTHKTTTYTLIVRSTEDGRYHVEIPEFGLQAAADTLEAALLEGERMIVVMRMEQAHKERPGRGQQGNL